MAIDFWTISGKLFLSKTYAFVDHRSFTFHLLILTTHFRSTIPLPCLPYLATCLVNLRVLPTLTVTKIPITIYFSLHCISCSFTLLFSSPPFFMKHPSSFPFKEILRNSEYRAQLIKMLKAKDVSVSANMQNLSNLDTVNLEDDKSTILFSARVENQDEDEVPPFYISLIIHNMFLHNSMLDSNASHNLMPKVIMDNLGLDITRPYKDLYSFDSRKVKCIGLIKDLVVSLHRIPEKRIVMDVVVADVPVKVGMLLSRS